MELRRGETGRDKGRNTERKTHSEGDIQKGRQRKDREIGGCQTVVSEVFLCINTVLHHDEKLEIWVKYSTVGCSVLGTDMPPQDMLTAILLYNTALTS
jgi:hypothetical protein